MKGAGRSRKQKQRKLIAITWEMEWEPPTMDEFPTHCEVLAFFFLNKRQPAFEIKACAVALANWKFQVHANWIRLERVRYQQAKKINSDSAQHFDAKF
jgi:hypothetical protein